MIKIKVAIKKFDKTLQDFSYATEGSAGMDLRAAASFILKPSQRLLIPTGIALAIPSGYEGQIRPRSGLAYKYGITVLNSPGTVDSDYRGEIKVIMINLSEFCFKIERNMRIAQLVFATCLAAQLNNVDCFTSNDVIASTRTENGFGSTGLY